MAPARKSASLNIRISHEASPEKDVGNTSKVKQRRKLSDKLGPQWRKGELRRFYEAYRKHGKDWKKVAVAVRYRSVGMVEALYSMNRAYLSLPEGTASVVGFIAMMTDYYNVMEESDGERETDDPPEIPQKSQKRKLVKDHVPSLKEDSVHIQSNRSTEGCLFYLKAGHSNGTQPRAVGKRTPRVPVYRENLVSPNKKARTSEVHDVALEAALALADAFQRGGFPQVLSSRRYGRTEHRKTPPVRSWDKMFPKSETAQGKLWDVSIYEELLKSKVGGRKLENGAHVRDKKSLVDMQGVGTIEVHRQRNEIYRKRMQVEEKVNNHCNDDGEACSSTERLNGSALNGFDREVSNSKIPKFSPKTERKSNKKLFNGDEMYALNALAELSAQESGVESSQQLKEEQNTDDKCRVPEFTSTFHHRDKVKPVGTKGKQQHSIARVEGTTLRKPKIAPCSLIDGQVVSEVRQKSQVTSSTKKRKRKSSISMSQASNTQARWDAHPSKQLKGKASTEEGNRSPIKDKRTCQVSSQPQQRRSGELLGLSSIDDDQKRAGIALPILDAQVPATTLDNIPAKQPNRRKMDLKRKLNSEKKVPENIANSSINKYAVSAQDGLACLKDKFSSCLSTPMVPRWCMFEWFYSAIDYPWFAKREFVEYLRHVGLGDIPMLTRVEWGFIRSSLGKPRRFSVRFLHEERGKLHKYRETVRKTYTDLRTGVRDGVPTDLAHPLFVGQRVVAFDPRTREIHDGSILTVDHDKCRVQFDRPDLGVGLVMDIDCMPLNPWDYLPEAIKRQNIAAHKFFEIPREPQVDTDHAISWSKVAAVYRVTSQQAYSASMLKREADVRANVNLANVERDALLMELQNSNNALLEDHYNSIASLKDFEPFKKNYATVQASSTVVQLRQRNTYPEISVLCPEEAGSGALDIVKGSRLKAHTMVDAAIQTMSSVKEGEDAFARIGETLDSLNKRQYISEPKLSATRSQEPNGHNQLLSCALEHVSMKSGNGQQYKNSRNETELPSELIASCVSTLLMIQSCTEHQYPPSNVAQIIDFAVTDLHPHCPQNLPLFREIQMCMGRVKTQILALIPMPT